MTVLLFDIDNTLLDFDKAEYEALGKIFENYQIADTPAHREIYGRENKELWRIHEAGEISREELLDRRFAQVFEQLGVTLPYEVREVDDAYQTYLAQSHELVLHAKELLTALSEDAREMYVVSNGTSKTSRPRILEAGISDYFAEIFISEEIGHHKPSPDFFDYVFDHIASASEKNFAIVGDSLINDIMGGNQAGIQTIWYNPKAQVNHSEIQPDQEIRDLLEILELIV